MKSFAKFASSPWTGAIGAPVLLVGFGAAVNWYFFEPPAAVARIKKSVPVAQFQHYSGKEDARALSKLPNDIPTEDGKLTLYADLRNNASESEQRDDKFTGGTPLYLVNRSGKDIRASEQDGDLYIKLEMKDAGGIWRRCQPHHYGWCGNSYHTNILKNEHYYRVVGYHPRSGIPARLRYALHSGDFVLVSQEFDGVYSRDDLEMAKYDAMALGEADLSSLEDFLVCKSLPVLLNEQILELREGAARVLVSGKFPSEQVWPVVRRVKWFDPSLRGFGSATKQNLEFAHKSYLASLNRENQ